MQKVFINTQNHMSIVSIIDHIEQIKLLLNNEKIKVIVSKRIIPNEINIFIEEFTRPQTEIMLWQTKKNYPNTKFFCFLTELPTKKIFRKSFNEYEFKFVFFILEKILRSIKKLKLVERILVLFKKILSFKFRIIPLNFLIYLNNINNFFFLRSRFINFQRSSYTNFQRLQPKTTNENQDFYYEINLDKEYNFTLFGRNINVSKIFQGFIWSKNFIIELSYYIYMKKRYETTINTSSIFDYHFTFHKKISDEFKRLTNIKPISLLPEIKQNIKLKKFNKYLIATGSKTAFRGFVIKKISKYLKNEFKLEISDFISEKEHNRFSLNLNIPQDKKWPYSSPIRYMRAINLGQVPVVYKKFNDHPIEKLGYLINFKNNFYHELLDFRKELNLKIKNYRDICSKTNLLFIKKIINQNKSKKSNLPFNNKPKLINKPQLCNILSHFKIYHHNEMFYAFKKNISTIEVNKLKKISFKNSSLENLKINITEEIIKVFGYRKCLLAFTENYLIYKYDKKYLIYNKSINFSVSKDKSIFTFYKFFNCYYKVKQLESSLAYKKYKKKFDFFFYVNFTLIQ